MLEIARNAGGIGVVREVVRGNVLDTCWRNGGFVRRSEVDIIQVPHLTEV